ncbi:MAG: PilZ domain-containing protein [Minwuia sp.]|nr:PilZ domain-containing protein [Minwuia sp.]
MMWSIGKKSGIWWRGGDASPPDRERRRYPRRMVRLPVSVTRFRDEPQRQCLAVDVSQTGMLITPNLYGSVREQVLVGTDEFNGRVSALIADQRPEGTAVAFSDPEEGRRLANWLTARAEGRTGNPQMS